MAAGACTVARAIRAQPSVNDLSGLLHPASIAVIGASDDLSKVNGRTVRYLLEKGYAGSIYPVNPKHARIAGLECYPSIEAIPEAPDLAVVAVPARFVVQSLRELGRRGARAAVVFSSGFAETGAAGAALERDAQAAAQAGGLRLCGPNCLGLINAFERVMATFGQFAEGDTPPGAVAFVTQSGAFGTAIAALARNRGIGLGYFINTGNEADVDFVAAMGAVLEDARIRVGAGYIEGLRDGPGLVAVAARALERGKPLVLTKVGRTKAGARAAVSHTGSLAGADEVFDGVARGLGVVRARNEEQMLDIVEAFAACVPPSGKGLAIVTQSGGAGVLMADRAEDLGLSVPVLSEATQAKLREVIPEFGATANPVDITGQFIAEPQLLEAAVAAVLSDPQVHMGIVWLQLMERYVDVLLAIFRRLKSRAEKPFLVCWVAAPEGALKALREAGIAVLRGAEPAVDAVAALAQYAESRRRWQADADARLEIARHAERALSGSTKGGFVPSALAADWLAGQGIRLAPVRVARTAEQAQAAAAILGFPVALKIESPDIPHKTEADGVRLGLANAESVSRAFSEILANARRHRPEARIEGVTVQPMLDAQVELVVGVKHDETFGPVVMVGLGGIFIEVLKDVAFRAAPVTPQEADRMLSELRGCAILDGARGRAPVDRRALSHYISGVSVFGARAGDRLAELDLNPVFVTADGVVAVDWLLVMRKPWR
jgi:acetyltransferase